MKKLLALVLILCMAVPLFAVAHAEENVYRFDKPLTREAAGPLADALEAVRLAPSAVNRQPWRVLLREGFAHFYEKRSKAYAGSDWDIQRIDMGIALCHFALCAEESGVPVSFLQEDPGLETPANTVYIATYIAE